MFQDLKAGQDLYTVTIESNVQLTCVINDLIYHLILMCSYYALRMKYFCYWLTVNHDSQENLRKLAQMGIEPGVLQTIERCPSMPPA